MFHISVWFLTDTAAILQAQESVGPGIYMVELVVKFSVQNHKKWQFKFAAVRMESYVETISQSKEHD